MKKFGLIGHPIEHSLSPALFRAAYGGRYTYDLIEGEDFGRSYDRFLDGYDGINVTAPFKGQAFLKADVKDPVAVKTGAANVLIKSPDGVKACNTDYFGVQMSLLNASKGEKRIWRRALVVGCGGAGKAAAVAAGDLKLETVIMNRSAGTAEEFAESLPEYGFTVRPMEEFGKWFRQSDVIIYAVPSPIEAIGCLERADFMGGRLSAKAKILLEANYRKPSFGEEVLSRMRQANPAARYVSGREWLLHQAITGYVTFTGEIPDEEAMRRIL